jgi:hypothetical protein
MAIEIIQLTYPLFLHYITTRVFDQLQPKNFITQVVIKIQFNYPFIFSFGYIATWVLDWLQFWLLEW